MADLPSVREQTAADNLVLQPKHKPLLVTVPELLQQTHKVSRIHLTGVNRHPARQVRETQNFNSPRSTIFPNTEPSTFPPLSMAKSTITLPGLIASTISAVITTGALRPNT